MDNSNDREFIDRFLRKELTGEELAEFNQRIALDDDFAKKVADQMVMKESFKKIRREEMVQILDQTAPWQKPVIYVAGTFLLIILLLLFFQPFNKTQLTEEERKQAIAEFKIQENLALTVAGPGWRELIKNDHLDRAIIVLDSLIASLGDPCEDVEFSYFAGVLHLYHNQNHRMAETYLTCALGNTAAASFRPDVPRHLVVAKTLLGERREAKELIRRYDVPLNSLPTTILKHLNAEVQG
jgi:hypothetical protein